MDGYFNEYKFQQRVSKAIERVKTILDNTRHPKFPADVHHEYEDKYILSEFLANSTLAAQLSCLEYLGLGGPQFKQVKEWAKTRSVTLRLKAEEECKFLRKDTRDKESDTKHVTKAGILGKFESFTVTKITEYIWQYTVKWELVAFMGVDADKGIVLQKHTGSTDLKTSTDNTPKPQSVVRPNIDVNITWLFEHTDDSRTPTFSIDRNDKLCRTPRRNPQVDAALRFLQAYHSWVLQVHSYFVNSIFPSQLEHGLDLSSLDSSSIFVPVLPLFEEAEGPGSKIPPAFMNNFLAEQARSWEEKSKNINKTFTANDKIITITEAHLIVTLLHANQVSEAYSQGVDYIEDLLRKQLVAAIGKVVTPNDFTNYLAFHNRKIFTAQYAPKLFSYAIRRPDHYPEGILSIEAQLDDGSNSQPISTIVSHSIARRPMRFPINAATHINFFGDRYLHGYVSHQFSGYSGTSLSLCARARQFSSFILLVGRIVSADVFDPKYAIIIQNKDDLKIPLLLETIPTPKEFKDAIASLSPEQQRFCKAFRSMQLESTLFGVCVVQIKPQLEKLLKLPDDSLTKQIQLSQDLLNLFLKYQIPSDLVSYDGPADSSVDTKIGKVKEYVANMNAMLEASKKAELEEAQQVQRMRLAQEEHDKQKFEIQLEESSYDEEDHDDEAYEQELKAPTKLQSKKGGFGRLLSFGASKKEKSSAPQSEALDYSGGAKMRKSSVGGGVVTMSSVVSASAPLPPTEALVSKEVASPVDEQAPKQVNEGKKELVAESGEHEVDDLAVLDYTKIPNELEQKFDQYDENNALRPTIINPGKEWAKTYQKSLLSEPEKTTVYTEEQEKEKNKAFDLLDALTKSGALSVDYASLHVVIASTHCFDKSIMETVIQDNVNPIEKVENSSLIVAGTIHQTEPEELIAPEHRERISKTSPLLVTGHGNLINL